MSVDQQALRQARDEVEAHLRRQLTDPSAPPHTVGIGFIRRHGEETGEVGVVVKVARKLPAVALSSSHLDPVPREVNVRGQCVPVDVIEAPQPHDQRLRLDQPAGRRMAAFHCAFAVTTHRQCHPCPIPGGVQIAPNKPWVGTLGCALAYTDKASGQLRYGALTNAHVTGMNAEGQRMFQPVGGQGDHFGVVARVVDLHFDQRTANFIDAAIIDTLRTDGAYAGPNRQGTHTVKPEQLDLGRINPSPIAATLGMRVVKSGRTTGVVRGRVTGIEESTYVNYGEDGTAYFKRQVTIEADIGNFSAGGDSGSLILQDGTLRPVALLFAGGGRQTIGSPIEFVLQWCNGKFFAA